MQKAHWFGSYCYNPNKTYKEPDGMEKRACIWRYLSGRIDNIWYLIKEVKWMENTFRSSTAELEKWKKIDFFAMV